MTTATDVRAWLGKAWINASRELERLNYRAKIAYPALLGPAIKGPLVQLYRADADFSVEVSFVNYLSFYVTGEQIGITAIFTAYDSRGQRLGSGRHRVDRKQALQQPLEELVGAQLDSYGLFTVEAEY